MAKRKRKRGLRGTEAQHATRTKVQAHQLDSYMARYRASKSCAAKFNYLTGILRHAGEVAAEESWVKHRMTSGIHRRIKAIEDDFAHTCIGPTVNRAQMDWEFLRRKPRS